MAEKFTDALTYVLSVALAAAVVAFAAYKVIKLNGMEDPPANMGLNFPPPKRKIIIDQLAADADPIITRTVTPALTTPQRTSAPDGRRAFWGPVRSYELLAVVDGVAFVEIDLARGKTLVPVSVGSVLPGGLLIESIVERNGRWVLVAGPLRLERLERPVQ
jgi:hypothetical protein